MTSPPGDRAPEPMPTALADAVTLRVTEARVEDTGHALARLAPADAPRIGAGPGRVVNVTGGTAAVARAERADDSHEGPIQIDGTARSNCGVSLQEQVTVAPVESSAAVSVRVTPLWEGAAPAVIAPERLLEDLEGVPVINGCAVPVPPFAQAG